MFLLLCSLCLCYQSFILIIIILLFVDRVRHFGWRHEDVLAASPLQEEAAPSQGKQLFVGLPDVG